MSRKRMERRLSGIGTRLQELREELRIGQEQLLQVADEADDARVRALVAETPLASREHRESSRFADKLKRHLEAVRTDIISLEVQQDELLDRILEEGQR